MTTDPQPDAEPELTDVQKAYNVAQSGLFHLAAYGHFRYWPTGHALPGTEDDARRKGYCARINMAREHLEAAVLRLVAEHAETFRGDWGIVAAWLRSLADDPAELSLLAVRPDERPATAASAAAPSASADRTALRDRIRRAVCEAEGFAWDSDMLEPDEYGEVADMVLAVLFGPLPAGTDVATWTAIRAIQLMNEAGQQRDVAEAHRLALSQTFDLGTSAPWDAIRERATELSRVAGEAQQPETQAENPARIDRLRPEFTDHASVESIDVQLRRARSQLRRWHLRVEWLISLRQARVEQKERGEWPAAVSQPGKEA